MEVNKQQLKHGFTSFFGESESLNFYFCPGRVCLIGEHLDYNGGHVLPVAISMGIYAAVSKNEDNIIRCKSAGFDGLLNIDLASEIVRLENDPWGNYVRGVIKYLEESGLNIPGMDIYFFSDLPHGAGLSSSAAIEVLTAYLIQTEAGVKVDLMKTALMCKDVENDFVGMKCGIMDQLAVALAESGKALLLNCETVETDHVTVDFGDYELIIINSNTPRALTESAFNTRKEECVKALEDLRSKFEILSLAEATVDQVETMVMENPRKRAMHVISENTRVLQAKEALEIGDLKRFGELMQLSHLSLKELYEVTGPELDTIAETASSMEGCLGARMTGAGFGGCCIALVKGEKVEFFKNTLATAYEKKFRKSLDFYDVKVSGGIRPL